MTALDLQGRDARSMAHAWGMESGEVPPLALLTLLFPHPLEECHAIRPALHGIARQPYLLDDLPDNRFDRFAETHDDDGNRDAEPLAEPLEFLRLALRAFYLQRHIPVSFQGDEEVYVFSVQQGILPRPDDPLDRGHQSVLLWFPLQDEKRCLNFRLVGEADFLRGIYMHIF